MPCKPSWRARFLFRFEEGTAPARAGQTRHIGEFEARLVCRKLLWSTLPDEELLKLAHAGKLRAQLAPQVRRMLADPRGDALASRFAW